MNNAENFNEKATNLIGINKSCRDLFNNINHEIRTPLNAILGFSQLLRCTDLSSNQIEQYTELIEDNSKQLLQVLDEVIVLNTTELPELNIHQINVGSLLNDLYKKFSNQISLGGKDIKLVMNQGSIAKKIYTDEYYLKEVFQHLFHNAHKFTECGVIEFGFVEKQNGIEFFMKDSGVGIDDKYFNDLFTPFFKVEQDNTKFYKGIGLGLTICKRFMDRLNGSIWLDSKPKQGSVFYFTPFFNENI